MPKHLITASMAVVAEGVHLEPPCDGDESYGLGIVFWIYAAVFCLGIFSALVYIGKAGTRLYKLLLGKDFRSMSTQTDHIVLAKTNNNTSHPCTPLASSSRSLWESSSARAKGVAHAGASVYLAKYGKVVHVDLDCEGAQQAFHGLTTRTMCRTCTH